jgi:hypothetical protein
MANYRTPSAKESEKLDRARKMMQSGIEGEKDIMSRLMPTMAKSARDDMRAAKALRESVPEAAREGEAYNQAGYKKGGSVSSRADGIAQRGKTRGTMVMCGGGMAKRK